MTERGAEVAIDTVVGGGACTGVLVTSSSISYCHEPGETYDIACGGSRGDADAARLDCHITAAAMVDVDDRTGGND